MLGDDLELEIVAEQGTSISFILNLTRANLTWSIFPTSIVPTMRDKVTLRLDVLEDKIDGEGEDKRTGRVALMSSLLDEQPLVAEAQVRLALRVKVLVGKSVSLYTVVCYLSWFECFMYTVGCH